MATVNQTIDDEIERYLRTGDSDPHHTAWPGGFMERANRAHDDLREALVREVHRLAQGGDHPPLPAGDPIAFARTKVEPMVRGLFQRVEQELVLALLEKSVVLLTRDNIEPVLLRQNFHGTAWNLANLYLGSVGAELLGEGAPHLLGLSEETTCYVSPVHFTEADPFADFIVHETAHVFHNCKRATAGLRPTRTREWLLDIEINKRETFSYACEAYSRIVESTKSLVERRTLAEEYAGSARIPDDRVDPTDVAAIVQEAAAARNGWKVILDRCAPMRRPQNAS